MSTAYTCIPRNNIDKTLWNAFVDSSSTAWLWHRHEFQDAICTWPGRTDLSFAVMDRHREETILAIMPLQLIVPERHRAVRRVTANSLGAAAVCDTLHPNHRHDIVQLAHREAFALAKRHGASRLDVAIAPLTPAYRADASPLVNPLLFHGYANSLSQTWIVSLRDGTEQVWKRMEGRARTAIRKAQKCGVQVRQATANDLRAYYALHIETCSRTGAHPHPFAYFDAVWSLFFAEGRAQIFVAECHNEIVAIENFATYKNAALYWTGAASASGLSVEANSLLQWSAIQAFCAQGMDYYETGEAFPQITQGKLKGLNDFKKSFGGTLFPFFRGTRIMKPVHHHLLEAARHLFLSKTS